MDTKLSLYSKHINHFSEDSLFIFFGAEVMGSNESKALKQDKEKFPHIEVIHNQNNQPQLIKLYRPIISSEDIYFTIVNGNICITNFFKHALLSLPNNLRTISQDAVIDHFLFRAVPGKNTYCENIYRVGNGEEVEINLANGNYKRKQRVRFDKSEQKGNVEDYLIRTKNALAEEIKKIPNNDDTCLLFSGGVDSGVIASNMPNAPLLSYQVNSKEFKPDTIYAEEGAEIFNRELEVSLTDEQNFFSSLENTIDNLGMPPHHAQTVLMFNALRDTKYSNYICGQAADGLYGLISPKILKYKTLLKYKPMRLIASLLLPAIKGNKKRKAQKLIKEFDALSQPISSADGFALNFAKPCDKSIAETIFGKEPVKQRILARYNYLQEISSIELKDSKFNNHIEVSHLIDFFEEDTGTVWHQLAKSQNKEIFRPFATDGLLKTAFSIPTNERYYKDNSVKYLLKELLQMIKPDYPATRQKLGGVLPVKKYFLSDMFRKELKQYDQPDFLSLETIEKHGKECHSFLWHTISFLVWQNRILKAKSPKSIDIKPDKEWFFSDPSAS